MELIPLMRKRRLFRNLPFLIHSSLELSGGIVIESKQFSQFNLARSLDDQDPRWGVVKRVVESPLFSKSTRLKNLLLYVTQKTLDGRLEEITESQIGVNVFGRPAGYNPADDNIVRSHARLLRKKLDVYFEEMGELEPFIITIPKGAYVPSFEPRMAAMAPQPEAITTEQSKIQFDEFGAIQPNRFFCGYRLRRLQSWFSALSLSSSS
jgi:hypothetical protein